MKIFILISLPILLLLNAFDVASTVLLLNKGAKEMNPYMAWLMDSIGVIPAFIVGKGVFISLLFWVCYKALTKRYLTTREMVLLVSGFIIMISYYGVFMYHFNYKQMLLIM